MLVKLNFDTHAAKKLLKLLIKLDMLITSIKSPLVIPRDNLFQIIQQSIKKIPEQSVLVITSKIIALCQGRVIKKKVLTEEEAKAEKHQLVRQEADFFLEPSSSQYQMMLTIKDRILGVNAGIDESNVEQAYVLWPSKTQQTVNQIWHFLRKEYQVNKIGVVISDSRSIPLKWGCNYGVSLGHCGFRALVDQIGKTDLFGREMRMTKINLAESLASIGVFAMGEVAEKTPFCLINQDIPQIQFQNRVPNKQELADIFIDLKDDIYAPLLTAVKWHSRRKLK